MFKETKLNYLFGRNQALSTVWTVWHTICQGFAIISQHLIKSAFTYWQHVAKPLILTWLCGGGSQFGQSLSIWCCTPRVWCQSMIYIFLFWIILIFQTFIGSDAVKGGLPKVMLRKISGIRIGLVSIWYDSIAMDWLWLMSNKGWTYVPVRSSYMRTPKDQKSTALSWPWN